MMCLFCCKLRALTAIMQPEAKAKREGLFCTLCSTSITVLFERIITVINILSAYSFTTTILYFMFVNGHEDVECMFHARCVVSVPPTGVEDEDCIFPVVA